MLYANATSLFLDPRWQMKLAIRQKIPKADKFKEFEHTRSICNNITLKTKQTIEKQQKIGD